MDLLLEIFANRTVANPRSDGAHAVLGPNTERSGLDRSVALAKSKALRFNSTRIYGLTTIGR